MHGYLVTDNHINFAMLLIVNLIKLLSGNDINFAMLLIVNLIKHIVASML